MLGEALSRRQKVAGDRQAAASTARSNTGVRDIPEESNSPRRVSSLVIFAAPLSHGANAGAPPVVEQSLARHETSTQIQQGPGQLGRAHRPRRGHRRRGDQLPHGHPHAHGRGLRAGGDRNAPRRHGRPGSSGSPRDAARTRSATRNDRSTVANRRGRPAAGEASARAASQWRGWLCILRRRRSGDLRFDLHRRDERQVGNSCPRCVDASRSSLVGARRPPSSTTA